MMYVLPIVISEKIRTFLAKSIGVLHCICLIPSCTILALGGFIEYSIRDKVRFIENYNDAILPAFLLSVGATSFVSHLICGKICWTNHNPVRRWFWSRFLLPTMIVSIVIFLLQLVSGVMCYTHVTELEKSFKSGFLTNMKDYKDDVRVKEEVDVLQIEFSCCGSMAYTDWFRTAWIHEDYLNNVKLQASRKSEFVGGFISDDVPFSCCSPTALRPCIHHHLHDNDLHYNYDYRVSMTINKKGCAISLMEYYGEWVLMKAGAIAIGFSFFQVILIVLTRILQTSISQSLSADNPEEPAIGYLCSCDCTRPKDILSIPHIRILSKRTSLNKEKSLEIHTSVPEIQLLIPTNIQDHGDSYDSSFDDIDDTLPPFHLPVDNSGYVPMGGLDPSAYMNDPLYVPMGRPDNTKYVNDPLYENVQTRIGLMSVPLEEPIYENLPNREDKLYALIDVDEEHIYHDEEVERYLREREQTGAYDNTKDEGTPLYENLSYADHTDLSRPNTSSHLKEVMQRDHSNLDENISFHSIFSVPSAILYPPPYMIDHEEDDTHVQQGPGHHNDINKALDVFRPSHESPVSHRQPRLLNMPSTPPSFSTPPQETSPPPQTYIFPSDPSPEQHKRSFHSSSQKEQQYQPLYQQTLFTNARPKEGQQQLPPPPPPPPQKEQQYQPLYQQTLFTNARPKEEQQELPPPPPPPPQKEQQYQPIFQQTLFTNARPKEGQQQLPPPPLPPPPSPPPLPPLITQADIRVMSKHNPNKTKNATDNLHGLCRGSLFRVRTSRGNYLSMHIQDKVDNL